MTTAPANWPRPLAQVAADMDRTPGQDHAARVAAWSKRIETKASDHMDEAHECCAYQGNDPTYHRPSLYAVVAQAEEFAKEARGLKIDAVLGELSQQLMESAASVAGLGAFPKDIRSDCDAIAETLADLRALADAIEGKN